MIKKERRTNEEKFYMFDQKAAKQSKIKNDANKTAPMSYYNNLSALEYAMLIEEEYDNAC
jgi:hypothetical protein